MRLKAIAATSGLLLALGTLSASSGGIALTKGFYSGTSLVTSTSGTCPVAAGAFNIETVYNPGPDAAGYITRTAIDYTDNDGNHWVGFAVYDFSPKTPAAGVTHWSGSGTIKTYLAENGVNQSTASTPFTFNESWTYIDVYTYYKTGTTVGGGCTVNYQKTRSFSGIK